MPEFIDKLKQIFNLNQVDITDHVEAQTTENNYRSMTEDETKKILNAVYIPSMTRSSQGFDKQQIPGMVEPIGMELISRKVENAKLVEMSVESRQAASTVSYTHLTLPTKRIV